MGCAVSSGIVYFLFTGACGYLPDGADREDFSAGIMVQNLMMSGYSTLFSLACVGG